ncbi:MAG: pentapeptide repeat-containing protein [Daejeonella sp.]
MEKQTLSTQIEINELLIQGNNSEKFSWNGAANYIIDDDCHLSGKTFSNIDFANWEFKKNVTFSGSTFENAISFENVIFEGDVDFSNTHFKNKVRFFETQFKGIAKFDNTKFGDLADFWKAKFSKKTIFFKCDFLATAVFSVAKFSDNVLFTYSLISTVLIFRDTKFEKGLDLSNAIIIGHINFFNLKLTNYDNISDRDENDEDGHEVDISKTGVITRKNQRETYRIIKNELRSQNSNIDALDYYALESEVYHKQLKDQWRKKLDTWLIFELNRRSNKYGQSWSRAIKFTLGFGFLFFYFTIINTEGYDVGLNSTTCEAMSSSFKYFAEFLLPTHGTAYLKAEIPNVFSYLFDFLGRIVVSYGIYQTIQAFRRFKNH